MTAIIILNWNGWEDTIECLQSLYKVEDSEFFIVLCDNGSSNESVKKISEFLKTKESIDFYSISEGDQIIPNKIVNKTTILYKLKENYGFAKGNNKGIEIAGKFTPNFYLLLNNDTVVEPNFLDDLIKFSKDNPKYSVLTPRISYFFNRNIIWNCGGLLFWGFRKYYYANKPISDIKETNFIDISFITGCALFFKAELIKDKPLFTERFFHGEEDFEFSYRMKRNNIKMACVLSSHIYHKVGKATKSITSIGKKYCYYLNRFINVRQQMSPISYKIWELVYIAYLYILFRKDMNITTFRKFVNRLKDESHELDGVSKKRFFELLNNKI